MNSGGGLIAPVTVRLAELPREMEVMVRIHATGAEEMELNQALRIIRYVVKRFPIGAYVAEREGEVVGLLNLGFQRPAWLTFVLGKLPGRIPDFVYRILCNVSALWEFEVANIVVAPPYRSRGVAVRLMQFAEKQAQQTYGQRTIALMVQENNRIAIQFYKRLGYERVGSVSSSKGLKVLMRKNLSNCQ